MQIMDRFTEELIQAVCDRPYLYDPNHSDYKNIAEKIRAWSDIAAELGGSVGAVKSKWRNLRDTYKKYRTPTVNQGNQLRNWVWASRLHFLDGCLRFKASDAAAAGAPTVSVGVRPQSGAGLAAAAAADDDDEGAPRGRPHGDIIRRRKRLMSTKDPADIILDYLKMKTKKRDEPTEKLDKVDYFFLNYADTFKQLTVRRQAVLKLELANLFNKAELADLDEKHSDSD